MPGCKNTFICLLCLILSSNSIAQFPHYQLETFGSRNGLPSSKIYALAQSKERMLWIGTELGLSMYDGYDFFNYQFTTDNETVGRILCITQDSLGQTWFGGDKGLFICKNGMVKKIVPQHNIILAVEALLTDSRGNIWVGDLNNLFTISAAQVQQADQGDITSFTLSPFPAFNKRVFSLCADQQQNIYAGSFDGIFKIKANTKQYETAWKNPEPFQPVISVVVTSPDSIFWNCLERFPSQMIKGEVKRGVTDAFIGYKIIAAHDHLYALTTSGVGSMANGMVTPLVSFTGITNNALTALVDAEDNIWVGSWEGLLKYRKTAFRQYHLPPDGNKEIFSFLEKKNGELLFGGNHGKVFTRKEDAIVPYSQLPLLFTRSEVMCMYEDSLGALWSGSGYQGISRYKNKQLQNWESSGFLKDNNCETLYPSPAGNILACTENGVSVIDPRAAEPIIAHYPFREKYSRMPELYGCFQTTGSPFWFYGSRGIFRLSGKVLAEDSIRGMPVKGLYINKITGDKKGNIWVATLGKGLLQCRYEQGQLVLQKTFDRSSGLPSDNVLSVLADKNDNIWSGDYMSLSLLIQNGPQQTLLTFNEKDGLLTEYYQSLKLEQQRDGTIWGLTSMGMVAFHPDNINRNELPPALFLQRVTAGSSASNVAGITSPAFAYDQHSVHFSFTAVSLTDPSKIRYAYRVKELDSNWTYTSNRTVDFISLNSGSYTFELIACNNNNVWTPEALQYRFTVKPPFWKTWWFRLLVILFTASVIFALFRLRIRSLNSKAAVRQKITELEARALRAQMNPHFIFNSLNAIQELIITKHTDEGYRYLSSFSKLLRMVLNNSEKNAIPLSAELEMIQLYLSLEALRFRQSFTYEITVDEKIEAEFILLPSLLLQPYVENAVWHGLRHKEGEKKIQIRITEINNLLQIEIEDNGIGREKAAEIKMQKIAGEQFESRGMKLSLQRIALLNQQQGTMARVTVEDKKNEYGMPAGTVVTIQLPNNLTTE